MKNNENKEFDKNNENAQNNVQWMICYDGLWAKPWKINFINSNEKEIRKEMMKILEEFIAHTKNKGNCDNRLISRTKDDEDIQKIWTNLVPTNPNNSASNEKEFYLNAYADYLDFSFEICACIVPRSVGK